MIIYIFTCPLLPHATKHSRYSEFLTQELTKPGELQGKPLQPSKSSIFTNSGFGKPDLDHSFMSEASFEHTLIHLLKSEFLSSQDRLSLTECHPLFQHLHKMLSWSRHVDFLTLRNPIANYSEQKCIDPIRVQQFLAAALHYDLDIPVVIRFLKGNYTGEYRNTQENYQGSQSS